MFLLLALALLSTISYADEWATWNTIESDMEHDRFSSGELLKEPVDMIESKLARIFRSEEEASDEEELSDEEKIADWWWSSSSSSVSGSPSFMKIGSKPFCSSTTNTEHLGVETAYFMRYVYDASNDLVTHQRKEKQYGWTIIKDYNSHHGSQLYGGYRTIVATKEGACLVAFRGTNAADSKSGSGFSYKNLLNNIMTNIYAFPTTLGDGLVHRGFYKMVRYTIDNGLEHEFKAGGVCDKKHVVITGHSLGGAAAEIFTNLLIRGELGMAAHASSDLTTFTYGQPRAFFECPSNLKDNARIHRFYMTSKNTKYDSKVPDLVPNLTYLGYVFCNPGYQLEWDLTQDHPVVGWKKTSTGLPNGGVFQTGSDGSSHSFITIATKLHMGTKYGGDMEANGYDATCQTDYN